MGKIVSLEKIVRVRIHPALYKRLKLIVIERDSTIPKVVADLIRNYITSYEPKIRNIK